MNKISVNRELSWLDFNARVLQESMNSEVPLVERLRFLGIFSNNLDEFYRIRYANIRRGTLLEKSKYSDDEFSPKLLNEIREKVNFLNEQYENIFRILVAKLSDKNIFLLNNFTIQEKNHVSFIKNYFFQEINPILPIFILKTNQVFPRLKDGLFYLIVKITLYDSEKRYVLIEVPTTHKDRFVILPNLGKNRYAMFLEDIIRYNLNEILQPIFDFEQFEVHAFKVTRDAELSIDYDIFTKSLISEISTSLANRKKGHTVRIVHDAMMAEDTIKIIANGLKVNKLDTIIKSGRYLNKRDFMSFPYFGLKSFVYTDYKPSIHKRLKINENSLDNISKKDVLLHAPYEDFMHFINFLRDAALDSEVEEIKITVYRLAKNSSVISALLMAVKNRKKVTVIIELTARFDEEANLSWAKILEQEGVKVIYGAPNLKVHSKICYIKRVKDKLVQEFACIGTGNFNEKTAKVYTDYWVFTMNQSIISDIKQVFDFLVENHKIPKLKEIWMSPFNTRANIIANIENEIDSAKNSKPAYISIKVNSLLDDEIIKKLNEASHHGVKIKIIVRGICSLVPENENIEIISIIDRLLEHSRLYIFHNNNDTKLYIASADLMSRNLDVRVEVATPIFDLDIKKQILDDFEIMWQDNLKARIINHQEKHNVLRKQKANQKIIRSQYEIYKKYINIHKKEND